MRVALRAEFDWFTDAGMDGVELALALETAGFQVVPMPVTISPGLPRPFLDLMVRSPFEYPFDVEVCFGSLDFVELLKPIGAYRRIAFTGWDRFPMSDIDTSHWDAVAVMCPAHAREYPAADAVISTGINPDMWVPVDRPSGRMTFGTIGEATPQRNFTGVLKGWELARKQDPDVMADAELVVVTVDDVEGGDRQVKFPLTPEGRRDLYASLDVVVSANRGLSRFRMGMEFMASGGTLMSPKWLATESFVHEDWAVVLPGQQVRNRWGDCWFDVDPGHLAARIVETVQQGGYRNRGMQGSKMVRSGQPWSATAQKLGRLLRG